MFTDLDLFSHIWDSFCWVKSSILIVHDFFCRSCNKSFRFCAYSTKTLLKRCTRETCDEAASFLRDLIDAIKANQSLRLSICIAQHKKIISFSINWNETTRRRACWKSAHRDLRSWSRQILRILATISIRHVEIRLNSFNQTDCFLNLCFCRAVFVLSYDRIANVERYPKNSSYSMQ